MLGAAAFTLLTLGAATPQSAAAAAATTTRGTTTLAPVNNTAVTGQAVIRWSAEDRTLTVFVTAKGLPSGTRHPDHIHLGSCEGQGPGTIVYFLKDLVANGDGVARSTTVIHHVADVANIVNGSYVNVHLGPTLTSYNGFGATPISCGDIAWLS